MFVCLAFLVPIKNVSLILRRHKGRAANVDLCCAFMVIEQRGFLITNINRQTYCNTGYSFIMIIFEASETHTCCRVFSNQTVTTCFNDLSLSVLGYEHLTFCMQGKRFNRLHHRRSGNYIKYTRIALTLEQKWFF